MLQAGFARLDVTDGKCRIDLSEVKKIKPAHLPDEFYVSFASGTVPGACSGGKISLYEEHREFNTYKVEHTGDCVVIDLS